MGVDLIIYAVIAIGMMLLSRLFIKKPGSEGLAQDDTPTTLSRRGTFIPYILGRRRHGYGFGWAGDDLAFSRQEAVEGASGGKGFGGGGGGQTIWYMPGWHCLRVGPVTSLFAIFENNKKVWEGPITSNNTPSGSVIEAEGVGIFEIYWGEDNQPISDALSEMIGIRSSWPGVCYIVWIEKRLGGSKTWPQVEYDSEGAFQCVPGLSVPYMLDNGTSRGVNAAQALSQLFTGQYPYGLGYEPEAINETSLNEVSDIVREEHLPINIQINDGDTLDKAIQGILLDMGVMLVDTGTMLTFVTIRAKSEDIPVLSDDVVLAPETEINIATGDRQYNRVVFSYKDQDLAYRDNDIKFDDDASAENLRRFRMVSLSMFCPTHIEPANTIANRRVLEPFGDEGAFKINAARGATLLTPGKIFVTPTLGPLRVLTMDRSLTSAQVTVGCKLDAYSVNPDDLILSNGSTNPGGGATTPPRDLAFTFFELPEGVVSTNPSIVVFRIRASTLVNAAVVWASADGGAYVQAGQQNTPSAGGLLQEALTLSDLDIIETGPKFETLNSDALSIRDLSSDETAWLSGSQIAVINNEAFYLRNVTAQSESPWSGAAAFVADDAVLPSSPTGLRYVCVQAGTTGLVEPIWPRTRLEQVVDGGCIWEARGFVYTLEGLVRNRLGTPRELHAAGDLVYIAAKAGLVPMNTTTMQPGVNLCVKTQTIAGRLSSDVSGVMPVCKILNGLGTDLIFWTTHDGSYMADNVGDRLTFFSE